MIDFNQIQRSRGRRIALVEPTYEQFLASIPSYDQWPLQEQSGAVALATNSALALGRNVALRTFADYSGGAEWVDLGSEIVRCDGSQVAATNFNQSLSIVEVSKTYQITFTISNYNAGLVFFNANGTTGTNRSANGEYTETVTAGATGIFRFTGNSTFEGDIDLKTVTIKQTGILASGAYANPGDNPMDLTNVGMSVGNIGEGNVPYIYLGDGATTGLVFDTIAEVNSKLNPDKLTMSADVRCDDWTAGTDVIFRLAVDANTEAVLERRGSTLAWRYKTDAANDNEVTFDTATLPGGSPTSMFTMDMTVDTDGAGTVIGYMSGIARGTSTITGSFVGNLDAAECGIFNADNAQLESFDGGGANIGLGSRVLSPAEIFDRNQRSGL